MDKTTEAGKLLLRLTIGGLVLMHGIAKLAPGGIAGVENMLRQAGLPAPFAYGAFIGEIAAPLMLIVGWQTRIAAILVAVNMLFAIWLAHLGEIARLNEQGGWAIELQAAYLFGALSIFLIGSGRYGVQQS